jgi:hypothetical protein
MLTLHTSTALTEADGPVPYLEALAEALTQRGWIARVTVSPSLPARPEMIGPVAQRPLTPRAEGQRAAA